MFRRAPWIFTGLMLLSGLVGGARESDGVWIRGVFTGRSPRPVIVREAEAWQQATEQAGRVPDAFVLVGTGQSMQPLYAPGTIMVMQQCDFALLRPGQTALYRNKAGKVVAHVLVTRARDGWRATGLNNGTHDMEPVVAENLIGIVIGAYQPAHGSAGIQVASIGLR